MAYSTLQRNAITDVLNESHKPLTAIEIQKAASLKVNNLGIATVYRTLRLLLDQKTITTIEIPGVSPHYELASLAHHHHFLCQKCNQIFELEGCTHAVVDLAPKNFTVTKHDIILYGECALCNA